LRRQSRTKLWKMLREGKTGSFKRQMTWRRSYPWC